MSLTLAALNAASPAEFARLLDGTFEHSPWVVERAAPMRPFASLSQLKLAFVRVLRDATLAERLALLRAHPELAGRAMVSKALTAESNDEQSRAGLTACSPEEFEALQRLNGAWNAKFGFPFMLAVRGPRGTGLTRRPLFVPSVANFAQGMLVQLPLHLDTLPGQPGAQDIEAALRAHYAGSRYVTVEPATPDNKLDAVALAGTNQMELRVFANDAAADGFAHALLVARLDNLGKGASGAAVQNLELMLGM